MHERDILHQNIKIHEVICQPNGVIKLSNLGKNFISEEETEIDKFWNRKTPKMVDTAISPESIKKKPFTKADDIWALGCLAYTLAAG